MRSVSLTWPGGEDEFALPIGALRALQEARNAGPEQLFNRLRFGDWHIDDIIQVLRCGLMGAGLERGAATQKVMSVIDLHPHLAFKPVAIAVLSHALLGVADDPVGEDQGETETPPENGSSPSSTVPGP
jgi:hypothetical protein